MSEFLDAQEMNRKHPDTFEVPPEEILNGLVVGDYVQVAENRERFWVELIEIFDTELSGRVDNDLVHDHSFKCDDTITFERKNILNVLRF
jgi:hypothetical protein